MCSVYVLPAPRFTLRGLAPCFCNRGGTRRRRQGRRRGGGPRRSHAPTSGACDRAGPVSIGQPGGAQRVPPNWCTSRHQSARSAAVSMSTGSLSMQLKRSGSPASNDRRELSRTCCDHGGHRRAGWSKALQPRHTVPAHGVARALSNKIPPDGRRDQVLPAYPERHCDANQLF